MFKTVYCLILNGRIIAERFTRDAIEKVLGQFQKWDALDGIARIYSIGVVNRYFGAIELKLMGEEVI